jgi:hypothetical protein
MESPSLSNDHYATETLLLPVSIETGTAAQGIVPYWNNSPVQVPLAVAPRGF